MLGMSRLFGAMPVTHVILAEEWLKRVPMKNIWDRREFILGNLFPDIRYLVGIPRERTHWAGLTAGQILEEPAPFLRGMKVHSFVDEVRASLMEEWGIHELVPELPIKHRATFYKLLEDEVLFDRIDHYEIQEVLLISSTLEDLESIDDQKLWRWHAILDVYFSMRPSQLMRKLAENGKSLWGISPDQLMIWSHWLSFLSTNTQIQNYVDAMILEVAQHFEQNPFTLLSER